MCITKHALLLLCLVPYAAARSEIKWPPPKDQPLHLPIKGRIQAPSLKESSGFDQSRKVPGRFWSHNDSTGAAELYVMDEKGAPLAEPIPVEGAKNTDWEDIAIDGNGWMWIADVGNNANNRKNLKLYQIQEPGEKLPDTLKVHRVWDIRYPDQKEFPPKARNFDCEALFVADGHVYLFAKHRADTDAKLYRVNPPIAEEGEVEVVLVGTLPNAGVVTAADLHEDGKRLAVLTMLGVWILEREEGQSFLEATRRHYRIPFWSLRLAEAICWLDDETLLIGNEQRNLFHLKAEEIREVKGD